MYACTFKTHSYIHCIYIYKRQKKSTTSLGKQLYFFKTVEVNGVRDMAKQVRMLAFKKARIQISTGAHVSTIPALVEWGRDSRITEACRPIA